jgi:hypothetical protein
MFLAGSMSVADNARMNERRWYRLHIATWFATLTVGGVLASCQFEERPFAFRIGSEPIYFGGGYGWPCFILFDDRPGGRTTIMPSRRDGPSVTVLQVANVLLSLVLMTSTAFAVDRCAQTWRMQLRLRTLFGLITVVAVLLILQSVHERVDWERELLPLHGIVVIPSPMLVGVVPWAIRIPFVFGLGCTIYTAGWLAAQVVHGAGSLVLARLPVR